MMQKALANATNDLRYTGVHSTTGIMQRYANPGVTIIAAASASSCSSNPSSYEFEFPVKAAESHNFLPLCVKPGSTVPYYLAKYPQIMTVNPEWKTDVSLAWFVSSFLS